MTEYYENNCKAAHYVEFFQPEAVWGRAHIINYNSGMQEDKRFPHHEKNKKTRLSHRDAVLECCAERNHHQRGHLFKKAISFQLWLIRCGNYGKQNLLIV